MRVTLMVVERTPFGRKLRDQLDRQSISVRELARRMQPDDPESARRNIARWLAPRASAVMPSRANVRAVAEALGVAPDELNGDDDDEESDPVATLMNALRRFVRAELGRAEA